MDATTAAQGWSSWIFDFDDTLSATFEVRSKSLAHALNDFGYPTSQEAIGIRWGAPFAELIASLAPGVDLDAFLHHYGRVMRREPPLITAGARDLLQLLNEHDIPCLVHTSSLTSLVTQDLEALGVFHLISMVFGSDVTAYTKPDPKSLDVVVAWLCDRGYCISRTLYVGDSVNDLMVARGRGLPFVAVLTGRTSVEAFRMAGWKGPIVRSLEELVQAR